MDPSMETLATGGGGFIGSSLCFALQKRGHPVIAFDNLCSGAIDSVRSLFGRRGFVFSKGDRKEQGDVCGGLEVERIFHLAANPGVTCPRILFGDELVEPTCSAIARVTG